MHAEPIPALCADPGWKSYTYCGKIKDNNIPFLLPYTASIFNPFTAFKTKTSPPFKGRSWKILQPLHHITHMHCLICWRKSHLQRSCWDVFELAVC